MAWWDDLLGWIVGLMGWIVGLIGITIIHKMKKLK